MNEIESINEVKLSEKAFVKKIETGYKYFALATTDCDEREIRTIYSFFAIEDNGNFIRDVQKYEKKFTREIYKEFPYRLLGLNFCEIEFADILTEFKKHKSVHVYNTPEGVAVESLYTLKSKRKERK